MISVWFGLKCFLKPRSRVHRKFFSVALVTFHSNPIPKERRLRGVGREGKKKKVADPCSSKTANKNTSKESLVVSHNMVKLEIAGNQPN